MSIELLNNALKVEGYTPTAKFVLIILANYADEFGCCYPSHRHIADIIGLKDTKGVAKYINEFEKDGFLVKQKRKNEDGGFTSNRYILNIGIQNPMGVRTTRERVSEPHNTKEDTKEIINNFEILWKIYPRKVAKKTALSVFKKIDIKEFDVIKKALQIFVTQNKNTQIKFIPHFSAWLNQERWKDEYIEPKKNLNTLAG